MGCGLLGQFEGIARHIGEFDDLVALVVMAQDEDAIAESGFGCRGPSHEARVGCRWQGARALDALLAVRIGIASKQEEGQRSGLGPKRQVGHLSIVHIRRAFREWEVNLDRYLCRRLLWQPPMEGPQ